MEDRISILSHNAYLLTNKICCGAVVFRQQVTKIQNLSLFPFDVNSNNGLITPLKNCIERLSDL
jgi:hypothetical protein